MASASNAGGSNPPTRTHRRSNAISQPSSPLVATGAPFIVNADVPPLGYTEQSVGTIDEYKAALSGLIEQFESKKLTAPRTKPQIFAPYSSTSLSTYVPPLKMPDKNVPLPGPAKLGLRSSPDEWLQCALRNQYLPEFVMKKLCEICKEYLMEGEIVQSSQFRSSRLTRHRSRIQHPARFYPRHHLRRSSWAILRCH